MTKAEIRKIAFIKSLPVLCSYIFLGIAYGIMMEEAGFAWYYCIFPSTFIYTGAYQFVLISFLSGSASLATIALTAFLMNSRQTFYALSYVNDFNSMGKRKWYMIFSLTDETYAVYNTLTEMENDRDRKNIMFRLAIYCHSYWIIGSVLGGAIGQLIPFELKGIDFCMTALFVIIFVDQWEKAKDVTHHKKAILAIIVGIVCLLICGQSKFMLPSLIIISVLLLIMQKKEEHGIEGHEIEEQGSKEGGKE